MLVQQEGRIINMSSLGGLLSLPFTSAYNASKFALEGYTESLRLELLPFGIWVSNLEPAYINSSTTDQSILPPKHDHALFSGYRKKMHDKMLADSTRGIPLDLISKKIHQIINTSRPAFRYRIGTMAKVLTRLSTFMPEGLFQRSVLRAFKIPVNVTY